MSFVDNRTPYKYIGSIDLIVESVSAIVAEISNQFSFSFAQNTHGETINLDSKSKISVKLYSYFYAYPATLFILSLNRQNVTPSNIVLSQLIALYII